MSVSSGVSSHDGQQRTGQRTWFELASEAINTQKEALAERSMMLHFQKVPELEQRYAERERAFYLRDAGYNLENLAAAVLLQTPQLFTDYMRWVKKLFIARKIPIAGMPTHIECLNEALKEVLPVPTWKNIQPYIEAGISPFLEPD